MFNFADCTNNQLLWVFVVAILLTPFLMPGGMPRRTGDSQEDQPQVGWTEWLLSSFANVPLQNELIYLRLELSCAKELGLDKLSCMVEAESLARQAQSAFDLGQYDDAAKLVEAARARFESLNQDQRLAMVMKTFPQLG